MSKSNKLTNVLMLIVIVIFLIVLDMAVFGTK